MALILPYALRTRSVPLASTDKNRVAHFFRRRICIPWCLACCVSVPEHGTAHLFTNVTRFLSFRTQFLSSLTYPPLISAICPSCSLQRRRLWG